MAIDKNNPVSTLLFPVSASKLSRALCAYSFYQHYGLRAPEPYTWSSLTFGSDMHRIFERIIRMWLEDNDASFPVNDLVHEEMSPEIGNRANEMIELSDLFVQNYPFSNSITGVELELGMDNQGRPCDYGSSSCVFRGKVDVMEVVDTPAGAMAIITDHKTTMHYGVDLDSHFQLIGYGYLARQKWPEIKFFRVRIYFARRGFCRWIDIGESHFERWKQEFTARVKRVLAFTESDLSVATPNDFCTLCGYQKQCPAMKDDPLSIDDDSSAIEGARRLITHKAYVKSLESKVKSWVELHGPIDTGFNEGLPVLKMDSSTSSTWDLPGTMELLLDMGFDLEEFLKVDSAAVRRIMKKMPQEQRERLESIAIPGDRISFKVVHPPKMK